MEIAKAKEITEKSIKSKSKNYYYLLLGNSDSNITPLKCCGRH
jgi:hypothetical protein